MSISLVEKAREYDKHRLVKAEIENAIVLLKRFREKYPFAENPSLIETLNPEDVFREVGEVGEFFHYLEYYLKPIGHLTIYGSEVYRRIKAQFEDFKELLYVVVDKKRTLAEKVDANWGVISGLGSDEHIAKKIIFCFNYEKGDVLPIFNTSHLEHFFNEVVVSPRHPATYVSLGEKYEYLTSELLKEKENSSVTRSWQLPYFSRFLYDTYPPFKMKSSFPHEHEPIPTKAPEELIRYREFTSLLSAVQTKKKISGEEFRLFRMQWETHPEDRAALSQRLRLLSDQ